MLMAVRGIGPFPAMPLHGEQGAGKTTFCEFMQKIIDPTIRAEATGPREERDLWVTASSAYLMMYGNLSGIPQWLSDGLCRIATGGCYVTRKLRSDDEEFIMRARRPVIINSIGEVATRGDLVDRCTFVGLDAIPEEYRKREAEFEAEFESELPTILGAVYDAIALGIRTLPKVRLDKLPRMADFAVFARLFAEARNSYDLFCFSEDDLRIADPGFVARIMAFQDAFGWRRLLMPNRFEWNPRGQTLKTWIDGDLRPGATERWRDPLPDEEFLRLGSTTFRRALNPHSGFHAVTATQLAHWIRQPHFGDGDCSFISPLESAATLGVLKTFPIYKAFGPDAGFLEIEHLDTRFSSMSLPRA